MEGGRAGGRVGVGAEGAAAHARAAGGVHITRPGLACTCEAAGGHITYEAAGQGRRGGEGRGGVHTTRLSVAVSVGGLGSRW